MADREEVEVSSTGSGESMRADLARLQAELADLRSSRRRLAQGAHADRRAIERALHDGVHQHLVALAVDLRRLAGLVEGDPAGARALVDEMAANTQEAVAETSALAESVYPPLLEARGFASALRSAAERTGLTAMIDVQAGARYPPEITAAIYWSCVDALSSASSGSQATVSVLDVDGALTYAVAVDGRHTAERIERLRDRIEALDGRLTVEDGEDGGSRVHGWLPLSR